MTIGPEPIMRTLRITPELAARHYAEHQGKGFYEGLVRFITSAPVIVAAVEGPEAVAAVRQMMGATRPLEAAPRSLRADYALDVQENIVHGSHSAETAEQEIRLWFGP